MSDGGDWPTLLAAQGINAAVIESARGAAVRMTAATATMAHDPRDAMVPADLVVALAAAAKGAK